LPAVDFELAHPRGPGRPGNRLSGTDLRVRWQGESGHSAFSIDPCLGREDLDFVRQRKKVDRAVTDLDLTLIIDPDECVLEPVSVVALGVILARVSASALGPVFGRMQGNNRLFQQVFKLECLGKIAVPDHRSVGDAEISKATRDDVNSVDTLPQHLGSSKDGAVVLHYALHVEADLGGFSGASGIPPRIAPVDPRPPRPLLARRVTCA